MANEPEGRRQRERREKDEARREEEAGASSAFVAGVNFNFLIFPTPRRR